MGREDQIIQERGRKLRELREQGINPYPHKYNVEDYSWDIKKKFVKLKDDERTKEKVKIAGRIMTKRNLGKLIFVTLQDGKGNIQAILQKGETTSSSFELFKKYGDSGDFFGFEGSVMKTRTGEISVLVKKATILSKAINPMPEKWHGLQDKEERYRKRYVDLFMNEDVKKTFEVRSKIIKAIREFLEEKGFMEVETPLLQTQYGGANAKPFVTHINAWDMDMYLSISPELYLKRLIVGGYDKVFTICKNFRNEGVDHSHNPEFTMIEAYWAYADYNDMMKFMEECWEYCAKKVLGTTKIKRMYKGKEVEINLKAPWPRKTVNAAIKEVIKKDICKCSEKELREIAKKHNLNIDNGLNWGELVEELMELVEENTVQPTHIYDRPKEGTPLCKRHREDERFNEQCEPVGFGMELGNIYTELNDPELQAETLREQQEKGRGGDEEAHPMDEDFIEAIKTGMPPTGGIGWGIDRMVMLFTGAESIRDVILFPTMRPEDEVVSKKDKKKTRGDGKVK